MRSLSNSDCGKLLQYMYRPATKLHKPMPKHEVNKRGRLPIFFEITAEIIDIKKRMVPEMLIIKLQT